MAIVKMKDIIASEFQVEIEHKQQKMNDVEIGNILIIKNNNSNKRINK